MSDTTRAQVVDAVDLLNDFIGDCVASVMVLRTYAVGLQAKPNDGTALVALHKMCISYIVLTLYKWIEFYRKYQRVIPQELLNECKELTKKLERKDIIAFRHKCIGHIWDDEQGRPLFNTEIMDRLNKIIDNNLDAFLNWVHDPKGSVYPTTIVSIVETLRDALARRHQIDPKEIIER